MNQKEFSDLTGLSESFVSYWLSGQRKPGYRTARTLADQFCRPIEFFAESEPDQIREFVESIDTDFGICNR
jgi:transcriptional regulator with XRE-family HTH domain